MANSDIPSDIEDFLNKHIDSVVQLEVLLLVHLKFDRTHSAEDVAHELRIDPSWTEAALAKLAAEGVLERTGADYRFPATTSRITELVTRLSILYAERRVTIVSLIFSRPHDPIRQFTDAFRFRKDDGG